MIEAITFDLWNTLFENISYSDMRFDFLTEFFQNKSIFVNLTELQEIFYTQFEFIDIEYKKDQFIHISTTERVTMFLKKLNLRLTNNDINLVVNHFESIMLQKPALLKKGVIETLQNLKGKYKLGLISDTGITPGKIIRKVLDDYGILSFFDTTIFSDETGYYKPHPIPFSKALKHLDCKNPNNAVHIGDLLETDVKGAKNYQMKTIWLRDSNKKDLIAKSDLNPDYIIEEITQILDIIQKL